MMDELTQRESLKAGSAGESSFERMLDTVLRLHSAADEPAFGAAATSVVATLLGTAPTALKIVHDLDVARRFGGDLGDDLVVGILDRARREALPVIDGQPVRGVALPILSSGRAIGALYLAFAELRERLAGSVLDLLRIAAGHIGTASQNLRRREAPADLASAAAGIPRQVSLHDAKLAFERCLLHLRLGESKGNVAAAARVLDVDRGQLSRLMRKHNLLREAFRPAPHR